MAFENKYGIPTERAPDMMNIPIALGATKNVLAAVTNEYVATHSLARDEVVRSNELDASALVNISAVKRYQQKLAVIPGNPGAFEEGDRKLRYGTSHVLQWQQPYQVCYRGHVLSNATDTLKMIHNVFGASHHLINNIEGEALSPVLQILEACGSGCSDKRFLQIQKLIYDNSGFKPDLLESIQAHELVHFGLETLILAAAERGVSILGLDKKSFRRSVDPFDSTIPNELMPKISGLNRKFTQENLSTSNLMVRPILQIDDDPYSMSFTIATAFNKTNLNRNVAVVMRNTSYYLRPDEGNRGNAYIMRGSGIQNPATVQKNLKDFLEWGRVIGYVEDAKNVLFDYQAGLPQ